MERLAARERERQRKKQRKLSILPGAPEFDLSAYLVYPSNADTRVVGGALAAIRRAAKGER